MICASVNFYKFFPSHEIHKKKIENNVILRYNYFVIQSNSCRVTRLKK